MISDVQTAFSPDIIKRFMSEETFKAFLEDYNNARYLKIRNGKITDRDKLISIDYKNGMALGELMRKYKMKDWQIKTAIILAVKDN